MADIEKWFLKFKINPMKTAGFLVIVIILIFGKSFLTESGKKFYSHITSENHKLVLRGGGNKIVLRGSGENFLNAVTIDGFVDTISLSDAIKHWLEKNIPGYLVVDISIPATHDGRLYLVLNIETDISDQNNAYFNVDNYFQRLNIQTQKDFQVAVGELLQKVTIAVTGENQRIYVASEYGPEVVDAFYKEKSTLHHQEYLQEILRIQQAGIDASDSVRTYNEPQTRIRFRRNLGDLQRISIHEFGDGAGNSIQYVSPNSLWLTVYIYDRNKRGINSSLDNRILLEEFNVSKNKVLFRYSDRGRYERFVVFDDDEFVIGRSEYAFTFLRQRFRYEYRKDSNINELHLEHPSPGWSILLVGGVPDYFIKIRATFPEVNYDLCHNEMVKALDEIAVLISQVK